MSATTANSASLSVKQAARRLAISEASVRRRLDDGTIAGYRIGQIRRVLASDVDRILKGDTT